MSPIRYTETTDVSTSADLSAQALRIDLSRHVTLRFRLNLGSAEDVEALRYARRAMIREERTRGLEWDEPSMEHPTFTPTRNSPGRGARSLPEGRRRAPRERERARDQARGRGLWPSREPMRRQAQVPSKRKRRSMPEAR